jgi:Spy/CpxP family protein refolding chaperone
MNQPNRMKMQVWLVILAVFGLGGITGVSLDRVYLSRNPDKQAASGPRRGPGHMVDRLTKDLNLNTEQADSIRKIFEESRKEFPPSKLAECPGFKEARQRTRERVNAVLNPEQQKLYQQKEQEREERMKNGPPQQ